MEEPGENKEFFSLSQKFKSAAGAFLFDDKLQRIATGPLLIPHDLNTLNTKFLGTSKLTEEVSGVLDDLMGKYIPGVIDRDSVLTTEGVQNLRRLSVLVNLASDLQSSGIDLAHLLKDVDFKFSQEESGLEALVSSEEMYRTRNYKMDPNVTNFPQSLIDKNPQLRLEPAYGVFIKGINSGKNIEDMAAVLGSQYPNEHTIVTFEPAQISGLKPLYGMNGV